MMIILLTLIALSLGSVWILLGENCCWSLLGLKGLRGWESLLAAYTNNSVHFLWYFLGNCSAHQHGLRSNPGGSQAGFRKPHFQDAFGGLFKVKVRNFSCFYIFFFFLYFTPGNRSYICQQYTNGAPSESDASQQVKWIFMISKTVSRRKLQPSIVTDLNNSKRRNQEVTVFVR